MSADRICSWRCAKGVPQRGHRHFFYGGSPRVVETLVSRLKQRFPGLVVAGYRSPPFRALTQEEDAADVQAINETRPDFVWVGLGMPKQEKWMAQHVGKIQAAALLGVGAAFDFVSETKPRAPLWMQRSGLEWSFRLMTEPRRLARRYLVYNRFLWPARCSSLPDGNPMLGTGELGAGLVAVDRPEGCGNSIPPELCSR